MTTEAELTLGNVLSFANEFRCYAFSRIDFLKSREGRAIYIPRWLAYFRGYTNEDREAMEKKAHFADTAKSCNFY